MLYPISLHLDISGTWIEDTRLASLEAFNSDMGSKEVLKAMKLERLNHSFKGKKRQAQEVMVPKCMTTTYFFVFFLFVGVGWVGEGGMAIFLILDDEFWS